MYANKAKGVPIPSDVQAKDKLAHYVYEYLMHLGAKNSANAFLSEYSWDKKGAQLGEAPGFLVSWWCVFWDLYCAAPERRDSFETTQEAKIFHDYTNPNSNVMPSQENLSPNVIGHNAFVNSPNPQVANNQVMMGGQPPYQRFHSGNRGMRVSSNVEYQPSPNNMSAGNNPMNIDQSRVAAGMSPISRLTPPGNRVPPNAQPGMNQMNFNGPPSVGSLRGPNSNNPPSALSNPNQMSNAPMSPMPINMQQQQQQPPQQHQARWAQNPAGPQNQQQQQQPPPPPPPPPAMGYSSSSPVSYNVGMTHHGGPGTPIIPSPQDGDGMNFNLIKNGIPGNIQFHDQNINHMVPMTTEISHHSHLNGEILDAIKHSPMSNISGQRHHEEQSNPGAIPDLNPYTSFTDQLY